MHSRSSQAYRVKKEIRDKGEQGRYSKQKTQTSESHSDSLACDARKLTPSDEQQRKRTRMHGLQEKAQGAMGTGGVRKRPFLDPPHNGGSFRELPNLSPLPLNISLCRVPKSAMVNNLTLAGAVWLRMSQLLFWRSCFVVLFEHVVILRVKHAPRTEYSRFVCKMEIGHFRIHNTPAVVTSHPLTVIFARLFGQRTRPQLDMDPVSRRR
ncbi:hypothetical protein BC827DRAFT_1152841 [Russula dissimulans]|nr:hypothetical protein BC827DRAFT_1152841 [Russula dissimulans]